jgi:hypothetical protein
MKYSTLTRITVPAAMVAFLTIEITKQQAAVGLLVYVIAAAAFLSSVGIELWGITAGDNLKKAWADGSGKASTAVQMVAYVAVAGWMLRTNDTLLVLPLVAALAYVASAWADGYQEAERQTVERSAWEQGQEEKDRDFQRQLDLKKLEADTAVKLARVEAKTVTKPAVTSGQMSGQLPGDFRLLTTEHKDMIGALTSGELAEMAAISDRTARRWKEKVAANGYHK